MSIFRTKVYIKKTKVEKVYYNLTNEEWQRLKTNAKFLSDNEITPKFLGYSENFSDCIFRLKWKRISSIILDDISIPAELMIKKITNLVTKLHSLDKGHGDLHIDNIGYDIEDIQFFILDIDTIYDISKGPIEQPWLKKWMKDGFDWEETFEDFVTYDYENWKNQIEEHQNES